MQPKPWIGAFQRDWRGASRALAHVLDRRISNRLQDRRAVLAGACNETTWSDALRSFRGGYSHWRCAKATGHVGWHRFNNYVWARDPYGRVRYDPLPGLRLNTIHAETPFQRYAEGRHAVTTMRQARAMRRLAEANRIIQLQRADPPVPAGQRSVNDYTDDEEVL